MEGASFCKLFVESGLLENICAMAHWCAVALKWSAGEPQEFGGGSYISRATAECEPLECLIYYQKKSVICLDSVSAFSVCCELKIATPEEHEDSLFCECCVP